MGVMTKAKSRRTLKMPQMSEYGLYLRQWEEDTKSQYALTGL
jgi:hypothetical protein